MFIGYHFGPNKIYGIELSLGSDEIDMAINSWEIIGLKIMAKFLGLNFVLVSLEISDSRATVGLLNCFLTVFWG